MFKDRRLQQINAFKRRRKEPCKNSIVRGFSRLNSYPRLLIPSPSPPPLPSPSPSPSPSPLMKRPFDVFAGTGKIVVKNKGLSSFLPILTSTKHIIGQIDAMKDLSTFMRSSNKVAILYGKPGIGKTSSVFALAAERNVRVIEVNGSDERTYKFMSSFLYQSGLNTNGNVIILIDEIEGAWSDPDGRSSISALCDFILHFKDVQTVKIIATCNNANASCLNSLWLPKHAVMVKKILFKALSSWQMTKILDVIIRSNKVLQNLHIKQVTKNMLIQIANGDVRQLGHAVHMWSLGGGALHKRLNSNIFTTCNDILLRRKGVSFDQVQTSGYFAADMLVHNIQSFNTDLDKWTDIFEDMSIFDVIKSRGWNNSELDQMSAHILVRSIQNNTSRAPSKHRIKTPKKYVYCKVNHNPPNNTPINSAQEALNRVF
jgi:hypothetical protein